MEHQIECISSTKEVFFAHLFDELENIIHYRCGVCSYGRIEIDKKTKSLTNLKHNKCKSCGALVKVKFEI